MLQIPSKVKGSTSNMLQILLKYCWDGSSQLQNAANSKENEEHNGKSKKEKTTNNPDPFTSC